MSSATIKKLTRMVPKCPTCHSKLSGHQFAELATAVCENQDLNTLTKFIGYARARQWVELREFREFKGDRDDLVANVVACGRGGAPLVVKSVFELYAADELLVLEAITQEDVRVLRTLIDADRWQ